MQRKACVFKHGADLDGELLAAVAALPQSVANTLRRVGRDFVRRADDTTVRALGTIRPDDGFKEAMGGYLIAEIWAVQDAHFYPLNTDSM